MCLKWIMCFNIENKKIRKTYLLENDMTLMANDNNISFFKHFIIYTFVIDITQQQKQQQNI